MGPRRITGAAIFNGSNFGGQQFNQNQGYSVEEEELEEGEIRENHRGAATHNERPARLPAWREFEEAYPFARDRTSNDWRVRSGNDQA